MEDENYDYNFDIYESEDEGRKPFVLGERSEHSYLRSRFSNYERFLGRLADIGDNVAKYSADMESGTEEVLIYRKLYGFLNELWAQIKYMQGNINRAKIDKIKRNCEVLIRRYNKTKKMDIRLPKYLRMYRDSVYDVQWHSNLNLDVEKINSGSKARELIIN